MIASARMYSVTPEIAELWRKFLELVIRRADQQIVVIDHRPPAPISELWKRPDKAGVFMCGLPFSLSKPQPTLLVAPVPSPAAYKDRACYWTDFVVRADSRFERLDQTFGERIAFTTDESQSGFGAPLYSLMEAGGTMPLYREIVEPRLTPMGAITAVTDGLADVAPLDSYALALMQKSVPEMAARVRVIHSTAPTAIPAMVASQPEPSLAAVFLNADRDKFLKPMLDQLLLKRFTIPDRKDYDALRLRFETVRQYWRTRRLAKTIHPAFAMWFGKE